MTSKEFEHNEFRKKRFKPGGAINKKTTIFLDPTQAPLRNGTHQSVADVGSGSVVDRDQVMRMEHWLRTADRMGWLEAEGRGGSTGFDGVVISASALEKEDLKWQRQASTISGMTVIWRSLKRNLRAIDPRRLLRDE